MNKRKLVKAVGAAGLATSTSQLHFQSITEMISLIGTSTTMETVMRISERTSPQL